MMMVRIRTWLLVFSEISFVFSCLSLVRRWLCVSTSDYYIFTRCTCVCARTAYECANTANAPRCCCYQNGISNYCSSDGFFSIKKKLLFWGYSLSSNNIYLVIYLFIGSAVSIYSNRRRAHWEWSTTIGHRALRIALSKCRTSLDGIITSKLQNQIFVVGNKVLERSTRAAERTDE